MVHESHEGTRSISKLDVVFKWGQDQIEAFESLKEKLTKAPILTLLRRLK